jgi:uncharacterized membrane protein YedE/YeeE
MSKLWQIVVNVLLYGFLLWLLYDSTIREWDPWFAFVVAFVLVLAVVISVVPGLRAASVSPGAFPYHDDDK